MQGMLAEVIDWVGAMKEIPVLPPAQSRNPESVERDVLYLGPCCAWGQYRGASGDPEAGILLQNWGLSSPVQTS